MFRTFKVCLFGTMALVLSLFGTAQAGQKHPGYLRTMDDLRLARALLKGTNGAQALNGSQDEVSLTIGNIESAMAEIDKGIIAKAKKPQAIPQIDARASRAERLTKSLRLLEKAREDCGKEKDDAGDLGLQARVFDLLDQAHTRITVAIQTINFDYSARNMPTRND
jgi:hypothetical protein